MLESAAWFLENATAESPANAVCCWENAESPAAFCWEPVEIDTALCCEPVEKATICWDLATASAVFLSAGNCEEE